MESNISSQPTQSTPEIQQPVTQPVLSSPSSNKTKYILLSVFILLMIFLVGGGAYYFGSKNTQETARKSLIQITAKPTLTPAPDQASSQTSANGISTWKTFTAQSGVSFKYPTNWTPKETVTPKDSSGYGPMEGVTLTSPNGLVIAYGDYISGLGGGCDPADCPYNHILKVEPVNIPKYGTLNLVELVVKNGNDSSVINAQVGLIDPKTYPNLQVGSLKQFGYYVMFHDKDPNKYLDEFHLYIYDSNSKSNKMGQLSDLSQYFKDPEVITAENILKTLSF